MAESGADEARVEVQGQLDRSELDAVTWLVEAATNADGVRPLSEHVSLHLRYGGDHPVRNILVWAPEQSGGGLAAYAHLDVTDVVEGASAELVVDPARRRQGYGRVLVETLLHETPDGRLRLWAHGRLGAAASLSRSMGFEQVRELRQLRRSLFAPLAPVALPTGIGLRTFRPGPDDAAWVELNARVFAAHPEQGDLTLEDLHRRMAEPWFDPAGFFLAERGGRLVGFHWTKVHGGDGAHDGDDHDHDDLGGDAHTGHGHDPIGEVYVVGVDPAEQGGGLGAALTLAGLHHLRRAGLPAAMLYVDADNPAALAVYTRLGFSAWDVDVLYSRGEHRFPPGATMTP